MLVYTEIGITLKHMVTRTYSFPFNRAFPGLPSFPGGPGGPTMPRPLFRPFPPENMRESTWSDNLKEQHNYPRMEKKSNNIQTQKVAREPLIPIFRS